MKDPKPILDYSSPAEERRCERSAEDQRRAALNTAAPEAHGQWAVYIVLKGLALFVVVLLAAFLLPLNRGRILAILTIAAFAAWRGWQTRGRGKE